MNSPMWRLVLKKGRCLVFLGGSREGTPFYCVHSIGGEVGSLSVLARLLPKDVCVYGIQVPKHDLTPAFAASVTAMASHYSDILMEFQPHGPFMLGGWSVGGVIALEMAHQLRAQGRTVSLLVALDAPVYNTKADTKPWNPAYYAKLLCNMPRWIGEDLVGNWDPALLLQRLFRRLAKAGRSIRASVTNAMPVPLVEGPGTDGWSEDQLRFARALYVAVQDYVPQPYPGRVVVYAARTRPLFPLVEIKPGWRRIAPHAEFVDLAGTHATLLQPPRVDAMAAHLCGRLKNCVLDRSALSS